MGEVYRAEDLKLGQTVALKFLPRSLGHNADALERFTREVRLARQVSHPNVCRVFDIGEAEGQTFLAMEFVDGEDLASLIRRIGRLPADKALEIARQTCAGLAAAHEHGIVHRDLKPANIMLDGRGRARITDFGLAGVAADIGGDEARAGTPAYMSPEQFAGGEVTPKSDLYSLGLVMYEVFTGKRPYDATTMEEMAHLREKSAPTAPSQYLKEIDPLIERVILRCLEKTPAKRPASALQVAAALPGGDPLAAALAAGETPSPEMVAASGTDGALAPWNAGILLAGIIAILCAIVFLAGYSRLENLLPSGESPEVLTQNARKILSGMGYTGRPSDSAHWFDVEQSYWAYNSNLPSPERYRMIAEEFPSPLHFSYRQSPQPFLTHSPFSIDSQNPPPTTPGDATVELDLQARLCSFRMTPLVTPELADGSAALNSVPATAVERDSAPQDASKHLDWQPLFAAAGLDLAQFRSTGASWYPRDPMDQQFAWQGEHQGRPIRVHAGAYRGRPVFFEVLGPWAKPVEPEYAAKLGGQKLADWLAIVFLVVALAFGLFLARRNIRLGRGDIAGSLRSAGFLVIVVGLVLILETHWTSNPAWQWYWLQEVIALAIGLAAQYSVYYLGLEPYFRRVWPELLVSWSRLLAGRFRDALVGRDALIGVMFGAFISLLGHTVTALPYWFSVRGLTPWFGDAESLRGFSSFLAERIVTCVPSFMIGFTSLTILFLVWKLTKRKWIAVLIFVLPWTVFNLQTENPWSLLPFSLAIAILFVCCAVRFGVLALIVALFTSASLRNSPLTWDFSRWYAPLSVISLLVILAIALYGFVISLGSHKLFGSAFED